MVETTQNINKTWKVNVNSNRKGYIENIKTGGKVFFRLGDYNIITEGREGDVKPSQSVYVKANSMAKKMYTELNQQYQFHYVHTKNGNFGLARY